ncbi:penicillin acylase family protein [Gracilimonas mengyeensis]|uniref:Acyl-homoserine lactone (AHL) acylase PvdQ n=1 Tax=Gracilimonas mengyeensis TaxID=1302730 RepID=A0A521B6H0_9BACT|nr:penicillin acylase family protein [Gracilimonas mengyeensis]SMO42707.1 Acyl-homoserine lactone (AHL) acylase PvdQ [Gracilimonas mengyeensis]
MRKLNLLFFLLVFAFFGFTSEEQNPEVSRWNRHASQSEIIRDDFGIPHIYGQTDADAIFAMMYAQAEDNFPEIERNYIRATGQLAKIEGEYALYSDLRSQLYMTREEALQHFEEAPEWLQELCQAWADGLNYYLFTHPEVQPQLITKFEPWMPLYFADGTIGGTLDRISVWGLKAFYEEDYAAIYSPEEEEDPYAEPKGSNGFAISGERTASGNPLLLINPHTSFYKRGEMHVVSDEGLNVYGAVVWGQFFVYQGFNEKAGWMHTASGADVVDTFVQEITERNGLPVYRYGDIWLPLERREVKLHYLQDSLQQQEAFTIYRTHRGPVTHTEDGKWTVTAMMWNPAKTLEQSFLQTKSRSYDEFHGVMDLRANASGHTVYADADGNIAYYHGNFMPVRNPDLDYSWAEDGSKPANDWQGLHTLEEMVTIINPENGWLQNCNSTPFEAAGKSSPDKEDYPSYMAPEAQNLRAEHAISLLNKSNNLTLDSLIALAYDSYLPAFEILIPGLVEAFDQSAMQDEEMGKAIEYLRNWDYHTSKESVAMTLAHFYGMHTIWTNKAPAGLSAIERIQFYGAQLSPEDRLYIFEEALKQLREDFGDWNLAWGSINRYQRPDTGEYAFDDDKQSVPVGLASGRWGALASYGSDQYHTKKMYGTSGNSFVAVVEFGERVKAKGLLVGGQSAEPNSLHFNDQSLRYAEGNFREVPFYREEVEARAVKQYQPGEEQGIIPGQVSL